LHPLYFSRLQHDRAKAIYKYAIEKLPEEKREDIYKALTVHEKKYGNKEDIELAILSKRKIKYREVIANSLTYDSK
jgi:crooked neck